MESKEKKYRIVVPFTVTKSLIPMFVVPGDGKQYAIGCLDEGPVLFTEDEGIKFMKFNNINWFMEEIK